MGLQSSVVDPKLFSPDPDLDPTPEKFRIRIRIRDLTVLLIEPALPVFLQINNYIVNFLKRKIGKFHLQYFNVNEKKKLIKEIKHSILH